MTDREFMIATLLRETIIPAADAAKRCGVSLGALTDWIRKGRSTAGQVIFLEGFRGGRSWRTTEEALTRFLAKVWPVEGAPPPPTDWQTQQLAERESLAHKAALDRFNRAAKACTAVQIEPFPPAA
jgi:transposase